MAILNSCCCWRSVRKGSYVCAIYTFIYFTIMGCMLAAFLHKERLYLMGETDAPESYSFLEEEISRATMSLHIVLVVVSILGVISSILLFFGLYKDMRILLLPWIYLVSLDIAFEFCHFIYLVIQDSVYLHPIAGVLYTADFFVLCLNTYALLCVISQYQEYKAGRGTASDDFDHSIPSLRLQYLSHHNAARNANQAGRSVIILNNSNAETQINSTDVNIQHCNLNRINQDSNALHGTTNISVIGLEPMRNDKSKNNNTISTHRNNLNKTRKVKFPDERTVIVSDDPSQIDVDIDIDMDTARDNTSEISSCQWKSNQHQPRFDEEPLLHHSPEEQRSIFEGE
ncbi:uncharacterized protein LOC113363889 [Ctenocephalides felis]|uniref:uncharacterized protein LOC113363889 n=1 Tax=Ctenocephalides felis TaxID=7515 RepID=UPI000E6E4A62|nr:uncharacterized protein LOC113363889 [Ctenocephalides felis]